MSTTPTKLTLRVYQVGFGDCFLLTFHYSAPHGDRHILIDFGSNRQPKRAPKDLLDAIADDIAAECQGKLDAVVLTHRHKDHIAGFATTKDGTGPGDTIAKLKPSLIVQPWTEDPKAQKDATRPTAVKHRTSSARFIAALEHMHAVSEGVSAEAARLADDEALGWRRQMLETLHHLGEEGVKNPSAVANLQRMGAAHEYVFAGCDTGLSELFPGVVVTVLGPPTLDQSDAIRKERSKDADQFWMFQAAAGRYTAGRTAASGAHAVESSTDVSDERPRDARSPAPPPLFADAKTLSAKNPPAYARWFIPRLRRIRGDNLLQLVRILDDAMNNTSVILLFEIGDHVLLFPGDAQIENWSYTLEQKKLVDRLRRVTLYKVGHHGSRNATPKSLWEGFTHAGPASTPNRLTTVMSTMGGVYGKIAEGTEVPRQTLLNELKTKSTLVTTQDIRGKRIKTVLEFTI
jgi:hypothetical protein